MTQEPTFDLIELYCAGKGRRYRGDPCVWFEESGRRCRLLLDHRTETFWTECRCDNTVLLYDTVGRHLRSLRRIYPWLPIDETEDFDFTGVAERLKAVRLNKGYNLAVWRGFVNKTVYREIKEKLVRRGLLARERKCGFCRHLPVRRPFVCALTGDLHKKTDDACPDFSLEGIYFLSMENSWGSENTGNEILMEEVDKAVHGPIQNPEALLLSREQNRNTAIAALSNMIYRRIEEEKAGSKKRRKRKRQFDVFVNMVHLMAGGMSRETAVNLLARRFFVHKRTIRRDIGEIYDFFQKKNVR
jgi:hypothetical protein